MRGKSNCPSCCAEQRFYDFVEQANQAVFDNGYANRALNLDAEQVPGAYDLVYVDTPYISQRGVGVDYYSFYHFLEGLTMYDQWGQHLDLRSKHRRLKVQPNDWAHKKRIHAAFERLFRRYRDSIIVVSYRSDGLPSEPELASLLKRYKQHVQVEYLKYTYALSSNSNSQEMLLIGT